MMSPASGCLTPVSSEPKEEIYAAFFAATTYIALDVGFDALNRLTSVVRHDFVERRFERQHFTQIDFGIRRLAFKSARRLMNHHARVGRAIALAGRARAVLLTWV